MPSRQSPWQNKAAAGGAFGLFLPCIFRYAAAVVTTLLAACGDSSPGFDRYLTEAVSTHDLAGEWRLLDTSLVSLARDTKFTLTERDQHRIELHAAGNCRFRSHWQYSYLDTQDPEASSYFDTTDCYWRVGTIATRVKHTRFSAPAVLIELRQDLRSTSTFYFVARRERELVLWQSIAEPEQGLYMDFVRQR